MSQIGSLKSYSNRTILIVFIILFGLISSRALISTGTLLLALNLILSSSEHKWQFFKKKNLTILSGIIFFLFSFLFVFTSPDLTTAFKQIYYRLPWLIIPLSIAAIKEIKSSTIHLVLVFFIFIITISGVVVLINYFSNYEYYTAQIALAKNIPTPLNHIRYSLMVSFAGIASFYFLIKNKLHFSPYDRKVMSIASIFIFALIHILSVRSGLLSYYLGLSFIIIYFSIHYRKFWLLPILGLCLFAMPYIAYKALPSLQNKVAYMKYDIEQIKAGNIGHNSDGRRWRSLLMAQALILEKPWIGHGVGQVENVSKAYYQSFHPAVEEHNQKVPHNQLLYSSVEMGVFGVIAILLVFGIPIFLVGVIKFPLATTIWVILFSSLLVENTFESQIGMSFYLILSSLLLKQSRDE